MPALRSLITSAWTLVLLASAGPALAAWMSAPRETEELLHFARDTWTSFEAMTRPGGLPADRLLRDAEGRWVPGHAHLVDRHRRVPLERRGRRGPADHRPRRGRAPTRSALAAVGRMQRAHGFFFNWYDARTGTRLEAWPIGGSPFGRSCRRSTTGGWPRR